MDHQVDSSRKTWLWLSLAASFLIYLPQIVWSFGHDQNVFAAIGSLTLQGFTPYSELWDVKPPNIFYIYGLAQQIFGRSEISIRIFDLISTLVSSWLIFRLIEHTLRGVSDERWVRWSCAAGAIIWSATNLSLGLADTAQTESFSQPFLLGAFVLRAKPGRTQRSLFMAGILLSIAAFFKLTNIAFLPALILLEFLPSRKDERAKLKTSVRCIAVMCFGFVLGVAIQLIVLLAQGAMSDFLRMMINVIRYHTEPGSIGVGDVLRTFWIYLDLFGLLAIAGVALYAVRGEKIGLTRRLIPLILLLITGSAIVLSQGKGWGYHYVVLLPALLPLTAILFGFVAARISEVSSPILRIAGLIVIFIAPLLLGPSGHRRVRYAHSSWLSITDHDAYLATLGNPGSVYEPSCTEVLADRLAEESYARERVFILGHEPGAYWKSDRRPASRFVYTLLLSSPVIRDPDIETLQAEVLERKPRLIVVQMYDTLNFSGRPVTSQDLLATDQFIPLRSEIETHYDLTDTVCAKFLLYKRRGKSPET